LNQNPFIANCDPLLAISSTLWLCNSSWPQIPIVPTAAQQQLGLLTAEEQQDRKYAVTLFMITNKRERERAKKKEIYLLFATTKVVGFAYNSSSGCPSYLLPWGFAAFFPDDGGGCCFDLLICRVLGMSAYMGSSQCNGLRL
jgi:hypothetical protein